MSEPERPADSDHMRALVAEGYSALEAALARVPPGSWDAGAGGEGWSPKEQLGHVTFWESTLLWRAGGEDEVEAPADLPFGDTDAVNARLREWLRPQTVEEIRSRAERVHKAVLELLAGVDDSRLDEPFGEGARDPNPIWFAVAVQTWDHYPEHVEMLGRAFPA